MILSVYNRSSVLPYALLAVAILLTVMGELLLKRGMNLHGELNIAASTLVPTVWQLVTNPFILGGFTLIFSGSLFWLSVISRIDLSVAYPMLSTGYVLVVLASALFLGEQVTALRMLGVFVIVVGVFLVFWSAQ